MKALFLALFAIAGCTHEDTHTSAEASAPSGSGESAYPSGTPLDRPLTRAQPVRPRFPCRAIDTTNKPTLLPSPIATAPASGDAGSNVLARDMQIPEGDWIDLVAGAKVTAKSPRTLRETSYEGPSRVRPCVEHDEEAWVIGGTFTAVSPGNESPGAEEWLVTSLGVVRYVSATFTAHVDKRAVALKITGGSTFVLVPPFATLKDGSDAGALGSQDAGIGTWIREDSAFSGTLSATLAEDKIPAAAVGACKSAAAVTKTLATELMAPDASISALGGEHTEARRLARGLCSVARVIVAKMPDDKTSAKTGAANSPTSKSGLQDAVDAAEKDWRSLP